MCLRIEMLASKPVPRRQDAGETCGRKGCLIAMRVYPNVRSMPRAVERSQVLAGTVVFWGALAGLCLLSAESAYASGDCLCGQDPQTFICYTCPPVDPPCSPPGSCPAPGPANPNPPPLPANPHP